MSDSTSKLSARKGRKHYVPEKPYPEFPLTPHVRGTWCKCIRHKLHHFGRWGRIQHGVLVEIEGIGWREALARYQREIDDLQAGRKPRAVTDEATVKILANQFLNARRPLIGHELSQKQFNEYKSAGELMAEVFGSGRVLVDLQPSDFEQLRGVIAGRWGIVRQGNVIQNVRTIVRYAYDPARLVDSPINCGVAFKKPSAKALRRHKASKPPKLFEVAEIKVALEEAEKYPALKAMLLLGINCGFTNKDCADLPLWAVDLEKGWIDFPRPKTGVPRRIPLWPETVQAIQDYLPTRHAPKTKEAETLVFTTSRGRPWIVNDTANPVSVAFSNLLKNAMIHRTGVGFATLRHNFQTVGDTCGDPLAVSAIMAHVDSSISANYREQVSGGVLQSIAEERLRRVVNCVHRWLFGEKDQKTHETPKKTKTLL